MRAETGYMQFGNDWRGVFIRGDEAGYLAMVLRSCGIKFEAIRQAEIDGLAKMLEGSNEGTNRTTTVQQMLPFEECVSCEGAK